MHTPIARRQLHVRTRTGTLSDLSCLLRVYNGIELSISTGISAEYDPLSLVRLVALLKNGNPKSKGSEQELDSPSRSC